MGPMVMASQPPMAHMAKEERDGTPRGFQAAQVRPRPESHMNSPSSPTMP